MIYRAKKACTDIGGRYFDKDEEADLNPLFPHSELLVPADPVAVAKLTAAAAKAAKVQAAKEALGTAKDTSGAESEVLNIEKEAQENSGQAENEPAI